MNDASSRKWRRRRRRFRRRVRRGAEIAGILAFIAIVAYTTVLRHPAKATKRSKGETTTTVKIGAPVADTKLTSCGFANYAATAGVTVTNHTTSSMNYTVYVVFGDGKTKKIVAQAVVTMNHLAPRHTAHQLAAAVSTKFVPTDIKCLIAGVRRFP